MGTAMSQSSHKRESVSLVALINAFRSGVGADSNSVLPDV